MDKKIFLANQLLYLEKIIDKHGSILEISKKTGIGKDALWGWLSARRELKISNALLLEELLNEKDLCFLDFLTYN